MNLVAVLLDALLDAVEQCRDDVAVPLFEGVAGGGHLDPPALVCEDADLVDQVRV